MCQGFKYDSLKEEMDKYFNVMLPNLSIYQKILSVSTSGMSAKEESNRVKAAVCAFKKRNKTTTMNTNVFSVTARVTEKTVTVLQYVCSRAVVPVSCIQC